MAEYQGREAYIPYSRQEIIEFCLADGKLDDNQQQQFRDFCQILAAYYHFKFHRHSESLKANFVPFNPDVNLSQQDLDRYDTGQLSQMEADLVGSLVTILEQANYFRLTKKKLEQAFEENVLFDLKTEVDLNDFDLVVCYCRGDLQRTITLKRLFRRIKKRVDILERVVLLIKFKEEQHFQDKPIKKEQLNFKPGKMYVYLYKDLSKADIEFIFPNVKMSMNWKDRLLFGLPAIGAGVSLIIKILPQLFLVIGVIIYLTLGHQPINELQVEEEEVRNITPLLISILSLLVTLGGFAFKQYTSYKSKQVKFQKNVTDTLFFRNIASNVGVFQYLIDAAEEEECKEIILVYYHLLTSSQKLKPYQLDDLIETWMESQIGTKIDFDINATIKALEVISAQIEQEHHGKKIIRQISLLQRDRDNYCQVLSLDQAKQVIDYVWDHTFQYA